jgi:hypothetical protein
MIDTSILSEQHVQAIATQQCLYTVRELRWHGWAFAAVSVWGKKAEGGLAGASFFDMPRDYCYAAETLSGSIRGMANQIDESAALVGPAAPAGESYAHTLAGSLVDARAVLGHMRDVDDAVLADFEKREAEFGALSRACRAERLRRVHSRAAGAPA